MPAFRLSKWYLDCITAEGDVSIAYTGSVRWGLFHLHYSSLLESSSNRIGTRFSLHRHPEPQMKETSLRWHSKRLDTNGEWRADSSALRQTMYDSSDGRVDWNCVMPRANVTLRNRVGLGYAEQLTMTIPPWKMPIQTLRWGRFLSPSSCIVWIDWQGEFSKRVVYIDAREVAVHVIADDQIEFSNGSRLLFDRSLVLREGPLGTTALSVVPGLNKTVPARLLQVEECKWRSKARLEQFEQPAVEGWAIHERVTWPE